MRHGVGWMAAGLCGCVIAGCASATGSTIGAGGRDPNPTAAAGSCAGQTVTQDRDHAQLVFDAVAGRYELQMIFDPATHTVLAVRTMAIGAIPAARIKAGTAIYEVSYLQGKVVAHPDIPPPPHPSPPTVESVPWQLAHVSGRHVTVRWSSGTCDPRLPPRPRIHAIQTSRSVTLTVLVHVVKAGGGSICAGVGLGGTLHTTLSRPIADRTLAHGKVTDHDQ